MLKFPVTYTDFNGNEHTDDLWFHISKTDVLMAKDDVYGTIITLGKQLQQKASFVDEAQANVKEGDSFNENNLVVADAIRDLARLLDKVLDLAYGVRTEDGMRFIKNDQVLEDFKQTVAYDALIDKLLSNPQEMIQFIEKLMKQ